MKLSDIARALAARIDNASPDTEITGVAGIETARRIRDGEPCHAGVEGTGARLVEHQVLAGTHHDGVARPGEDPQGDLIGHGPRRDEQGRLLAGQLGEGLLQEIDRRILSVLVIANLGLRHGPAHLCCRSGDSVGAQVDQHGATVRYNWHP